MDCKITNKNSDAFSVYTSLGEITDNFFTDIKSLFTVVEGDKYFNAQKTQEVLDMALKFAVDEELSGDSSTNTLDNKNVGVLLDNVKSKFIIYNTALKNTIEGKKDTDIISLPAMIQRFGERTVSDYKEIIEDVEFILNNFESKPESLNSFTDLFLNRLRGFGVKIVNTDNQVLEIQEQLTNDNTTWDDGWSFKVDPKETATIATKKVLSLIPQKNNKGEVVRNYFGFPKYVNNTVAFYEIANALNGRVYKTSQEFVENLSKAGNVNVNSFLELYEKLPQNIKNQVYTALTKQQAEFKKLLWGNKRIETPNGEITIKSLNIVDSNQSSKDKQLYNIWKTDYNASAYTKNRSGNVIIDKSKINKLKEKFLAKIKNRSNVSSANPWEHSNKFNATELKNFFNFFGIDLSNDTLRAIIKTPNEVFKLNGKGGAYSNLFKAKSSSPLYSLIESFLQADSIEEVMKDGYFKNLAKYDSNFKEVASTNTIRNINGDSVQTHVMHTFLSKQLDRLTSNRFYRDKIMNSPFGGDSFLGKQFLEDFNETPRIFYIDGVSKENDKNRGTKTITERELNIFSLSAFQSISTSAKASLMRSALVQLPAISDKTTIPLMSMNVIDFGGNSDLYTLNDDGSVTVSAGALNAMFKYLVMPEARRIIDFQGRSDVSMFPKQYREGAGKFLLLANSIPDLNNKSMPFWQDGKLGLDNNSEGVASLKTLLETYLNKSIEKTYQSFLEQDIISINKKGNVYTRYMNDSYVNRIREAVKDKSSSKDSKITTMQVAKVAAMDYQLNHNLALMGYVQMIGGDPAFAYKKNEVLTFNEYVKRIASDIAPGKQYFWTGVANNQSFDNSKYISIAIPDIKTSKYNQYYQDVLGVRGYVDVEGADGQEYTTLEEHLHVMFADGQINETTYTTLLNKADNEKSFTDEELGVILSPMKPVQVDYDTEKGDNVFIKKYIKTSSYPLIPQLTEMFPPLEELRKAMNKLSKANNNVGVRASMLSGVKEGATDVVEAFKKDSNGNVIFNNDIDIDAITPSLLDRFGFKIQQDNPQKTKEKITQVSQMNKLVIEGLREVKDGKNLFDGFQYNGKTWSGKQISALKNNLKAEKYKRALNKFKESLEITTSEDGSLIINNMEKIANLFKEEMAKRDNFSINDYLSVSLKDKKSLNVSLMFTPNSKRFEALLGSILTNRLLKDDVSGKAYVQGSSQGLVSNSKLYEVPAIKNKIIFTDSFDESKGLQFTRYVELNDDNTPKLDSEGKEILISKEAYDKLSEEQKQLSFRPAQIMVPRTFKDLEGNEIDLSKFIDKETNRLDTTKVPKELLRIIGARIPNQSHSNMSVMEIVGFLPKNLGNLALVPEEITKQMGSDFDVDKLFTYQYKYKVVTDANGNERIEKIKFNREKAINRQEDIQALYEEYSDKLERSVKYNKGRLRNTIAKLKPDRKVNDSTYDQMVSDYSNAYATKKLATEKLEYINNKLEELENYEESLGETTEFNYKEFEKIDNARKKLIANRRNYAADISIANQDLSSIEEVFTNEQIKQIEETGSRRIAEITAERDKKISLAKKQYKNTPDEELASQSELNNMYIEIHESILTQSKVVQKSLQVTDMPDIDEITDNLKKLEKKDDLSFLDINNHIKTKIKNRGAKAGVGVYALAATTNSLFQDLDLDIDLSFQITNKSILKALGIKENSYSFIPEGFTKISGHGTVDTPWGVRTKSQNISILLGTAVDDAKYNRMFTLGLNDETIGVSALMSLLETSDGRIMSLEEITTFLNEPIIKKYNDLIIQNGDSMAVSKLTRNQILEQILLENKNEKERETLFTFLAYKEASQDLRKIQALLNIDSAGLPASITELMLKKEDQELMFDRGKIKGLSKLLQNNPEISSLLTSGYDFALDFMTNDSFFPYQEIMSLATFTIEQSNLLKNVDSINSVIDNIKSFIYSKDQLLFEDNVNNERRRLLVSEDSVSDQLVELKKKYSNNLFLKSMVKGKTIDNIKKVKFVRDFSNSYDQNDIISSTVDLLKTEDGKKFIDDYLRYEYYTNGNFTYNSGLPFIPISYILNTNLSELGKLLADREINFDDFQKQFLQANPEFAKTADKTLITVKNNKVEFSEEALTDTKNNVIENGIYKVKDNNDKFVLVEISSMPLKGTIVPITNRANIRLYNVGKNTSEVIAEQSNNPQQTSNQIANVTKSNTNKLKSDAFGREGKIPKSDAVQRLFTLTGIEPDSSISDALAAMAFQGQGFNELSVLLASVLPVSTKLSFDNLIGSAGEWSKGSLKINPLKVSRLAKANGLNDVELFKETIIHEAIHEVTASKLAVYEQMNGATDDLTTSLAKDQPPLSEREIEAIRSLKAVFNKAKDSMAQAKSGTRQKNVAYGMSNIYEFVAATMSNKDFQDFLNNIPFQNQTLLSRFVELLTDLFKDISLRLGMPIEKGSALEAALVNSITLLGDIEKGVTTTKEAVLFSNKDDDSDEDIPKGNEDEPIPSGDEAIPNDDDFELNVDEDEAIPSGDESIDNDEDESIDGNDDESIDGSTDEPIEGDGDTSIGGEYFDDDFDFFFEEITDEERQRILEEGQEFKSVFGIMVQTLENKISSLKATLTPSKKSNEKVKINQEISKIEKQLQELKESNSWNAIFKIGDQNLKRIELLLKNPKHLDATDLVIIHNDIGIWKNIRDILNLGSNVANEKKASNILGQKYESKALYLESLWYQIAAEKLNESISNIGLEDIKVSNRIQTTDVNPLSSMFRDISMFNNDFTIAIDRFLQNSATATNQEYLKFEKELEKIMSEFRKSDEFAKYGFDIFFEKDEEGNNLNRLNQIFSHIFDSYMNKTDNFISNINSVSKSKALQNQIAHHKSRENNTEIINYDAIATFTFDADTLDLTRDSDGNVVNKDNSLALETEKTRLLKLYDKDVVETALKEASKKYNNFIKDFEEFREMTLQENLSKEDFQGTIKEWLSNNSPKVYQANRIGVKNNKGLSSNGLRNRGNKYSVFLPKKTKKTKNRFYDPLAKKYVVKENIVETRFFNENYSTIENNPQLLKVRDFFQNSMSYFMSLLPDNIQDSTSGNYIPEVMKSIMDVYSTNGTGGIKDRLRDDFLNTLASKEENEQTFLERDPNTGRVIKRVPIRFLADNAYKIKENIEKTKQEIQKIESKLSSIPNNNLERKLESKKSKLVSLEEAYKDLLNNKTNDLETILTAFSMMALNYKHKTKVEDTVLVLQKMLNNSLEKQKTSSGVDKLDKFGKAINVFDGNKQLKEAVNYAIDNLLYENKKEVEGVTKKKIYKNKEQAKRAKELEKYIENLKAELENPNTSVERKGKLYVALQDYKDEYKLLNGKNVTISGAADLLIKATQIKGIGYNPFSAISNLGFGFISNITHANGNEDFTMDEFIAATKILLGNAVNFSKENPLGDKVKKAMEKFDIMFEVNEALYGTNKNNRNSSLLNPYEMQKRTEFINQGIVTVAMLMNTKVTTKDGVETSVWEAMDDEGNINVEGFSEFTDPTKDTSFSKLKRKIIKTNVRLHGNYDPKRPIMINKTALGRLLTTFRRWMFEGVANRFEDKIFDRDLNRYRYGRYRTMADLGIKKSLQALAIQLIGANNADTIGGNSLEGLNEIDLANMRKNFAEVAIWFNLALLGMALKYLMEDDEDELGATDNLILNLLNRVKDDILFYVWPPALIRVVKDPAPALSTITDAIKGVEGVFNYITKDGHYYDEDYMARRVLKNIPVLNIYPKTRGLTDRLW